MEFYLRWLDKHERAAGEEPPIGLIRCAGADAEQVELLELDAKSIRVSEYLTELPPMKLLQSRLHQAIEHAREQAARGRVFLGAESESPQRSVSSTRRVRKRKKTNAPYGGPDDI
jgi:hypothetical protein